MEPTLTSLPFAEKLDVTLVYFTRKWKLSPQNFEFLFSEKVIEARATGDDFDEIFRTGVISKLTATLRPGVELWHNRRYHTVVLFTEEYSYSFDDDVEFARHCSKRKHTDPPRVEPESLKTCRQCLRDVDEEWFHLEICKSCWLETRRAKRIRDVKEYFKQRDIATPRNVDRAAIAAFYEEARNLTRLTGQLHHVDHHSN